jgi:hypothetical protein
MGKAAVQSYWMFSHVIVSPARESNPRSQRWKALVLTNQNKPCHAMPTTIRHMIYSALNIPWEDKPCLCSNISYLRRPLSVSLPLRCPGCLPGLKTKKLDS